MLKPNTITYRIAEFIYTRGPVKIAQITDAYPTVNRNTIHSSLGRLAASCYIERDDDILSVAADIRRFFDGIKADKETQQIAQRRDFKPFNEQLHPSRLPSMYGMREGADDFRAWPSRM